MIQVSFLGTNKFEPVTYIWEDGRICSTHLFPEALSSWIEPSEVLVLLTKEAKAHSNWTALQEKLGEKAHPIDIPSGRSEEELWEMFDTLTDKLPKDQDIILDVTHGFRSLPILALLAATYLRIAGAIRLKKVLYGAFEAPDEQGRRPVFDLTPFLSLLDWTTATNQFIKTGDARDIAKLLSETQSSLHRSEAGQIAKKPGSNDLPTRLKSVAGHMEKVSQALSVARPKEVLPAAAALTEALQSAEAEARKWAKPFALLLEQTRTEYQTFALSNRNINLKHKLSAQWEQIKWYLVREHVIQAVTLSREWVVSVVCWKIDRDWDDFDSRSKMETALNTHGRRKREPESLSVEFEQEVAKLDADGRLAALWNELAQLRNDIAHCGMGRQSGERADSLIQRVMKLRPDLQQFAVSFELDACGQAES